MTAQPQMMAAKERKKRKEISRGRTEFRLSQIAASLSYTGFQSALVSVAN